MYLSKRYYEGYRQRGEVLPKAFRNDESEIFQKRTSIRFCRRILRIHWLKNWTSQRLNYRLKFVAVKVEIFKKRTTIFCLKLYQKMLRFLWYIRKKSYFWLNKIWRSFLQFGGYLIETHHRIYTVEPWRISDLEAITNPSFSAERDLRS